MTASNRSPLEAAPHPNTSVRPSLFKEYIFKYKKRNKGERKAVYKKTLAVAYSG